MKPQQPAIFSLYGAKFSRIHSYSSDETAEITANYVFHPLLILSRGFLFFAQVRMIGSKMLFFVKEVFFVIVDVRLPDLSFVRKIEESFSYQPWYLQYNRRMVLR